MRVTFSLALPDWLAAQAHYQRTAADLHQSIRVWRWIYTLGLGLLAAWGAADAGPIVALLMSLMVAVPVFVWYPRLQNRRYIEAARKGFSRPEVMRYFVGVRTVEITDAGLTIESAAGVSSLRPEFIAALEESPDYLFVSFRVGLPLPIPRRELKDGGAFVSELRTHLARWAAARPTSTEAR